LILANGLHGVTGNAISIYLPERGRYVLSLEPHPEHGLQKAGEIRGSALNFTAGGDTVTIECNGRIAPGSAPYDLYLLFDPAWRPRNAHDRASFLMSSGSLDLLLRRSPAPALPSRYTSFCPRSNAGRRRLNPLQKSPKVYPRA
jgi:hypothetical protein